MLARSKFSTIAVSFCAATIISSAGPVVLAKPPSDSPRNNSHAAHSSQVKHNDNGNKANSNSAKKHSSSRTNRAQTPPHTSHKASQSPSTKQKSLSKNSSKPSKIATFTTQPSHKTEHRGNSGTVKIDGEPFDTHPDNEPHVGCNFQTDFYNYGEGSDLYSNSIFTAHPPTGRGVLLTDRVFVGEDAAGSGWDVDAQPEYNLMAYLSGFTPHPKQGYHIKLATNLEGSPGGPKQKVFWVKCAPPTNPGPTTPPTTKPPEGGRGGDTEVIPTATPPPTRPVVNLAAASTAAAPSTATASESMQLPETGKKDSQSLWAMVYALVILAAAVYWRKAITPLLRR